MFEKLLGLLPYNPGLLHQISFYAKRMRRETALRRVGLIFIVLAFFIQFFAFISPPQSTVANSTNDLINGGFSTQSQAVTACTSNIAGYKTILANYGVSCADVAAGTTQNISSIGSNNNFYSMGRNAEGSVNFKTNKSTNETAVSLVGLGKPVYWRLLSSWDTGPSSTYKALKLTSSVTHHTYFILYLCGNLVSSGIPSTLQPCDYNSKIFSNSPQCRPAPCQYDASILATAAGCKAPVPCSLDNTIYQTSPACVPCPYNASITANNLNCKNTPTTPQVCSFNPALLASDANCHPALCPQDSSIYLTNPACQACPFNSSILRTNAQCVACPNPRYDTFGASSSSCKQICPFNNVFDLGDAGCKPCKASSTSADALACMIVSKTASDPTQGWTDANGKTAKPSDTIIYSLNAKNGGLTLVKGFVMQENLSDVLDYATVVDLNGATITTDGEVSWSAVDISSGTSISHTITVKVKDSIPQTPTSASDPSHFDLVMTNVYGNSVNIAVPGGIINSISSTTTLVNTGPGTNLFLTAAVVMLAGYFYFRSRLLYKESYVVINEASGA